ncbi:outer membrane receptor protein [Galbibacter orientalis DSM 19592]|uniref:Outer membrane receptor protein n=1 Tax=Galbibacter orientalis DSM 19592 TaxID=926559 RepID=I3C682_9FLAO|nr:TonB-dependent receptor [Galbibacter orientalis]EIJ39125.1 outer membrane receptor protein [Galbibacter orientalis DSM 19592]
MQTIQIKKDNNIQRHTMRKNLIISALLILSSSYTVMAQEKETDEKQDENIGTQVVNVVKPYTPTISDANKIQEKPSLNDSITTAKKTINYNIFSVPVASTFTPAKGKATGLQKAVKERLYNSYLSLGLGNYNSAKLDFYTSHDFSRDESLDVMLNHHSSQGGIDNVVLDDKFYNTSLEAYYRQRDRYMSWGVNGGFKHQIYNWYGIPQGVYSETQINSIDEKQSYYTGFVGANMDFVDSYFTGGEIYYRRFWDGFSSGENRAVLKPKFQFPVGEELLSLDVEVDYVGGNFDRQYANTDEINYSNIFGGVTPSIQILTDRLAINLGASVYYNQDLENSDGDVFFYPEVDVSYDIVEEYVAAYGGIKGDLKQNSYYEYAQENPYVSPTINMMPTDQKYNGFAGLKGRFLPNVGYNIKGSYIKENNKYLYRSNSYNTGSDSGIVNDEGYAFGNSFEVVYDDVTTISVFGEINVDLTRDFTLGINGQFSDYSTDDEAEAWNLPTIKGSLFGNYSKGKWSAGVNAFYIGERKDYINSPNLLPSEGPIVRNLDGYFDLNANIGYDITEQWSAFIKANNITGSQYDRLVNYPVQGFQILAGAAYKFDL